jgi:hypothetical protein
MILYVCPMSQEGNFHFLKFCECLTNHQRGSDVRKMLVYKKQSWNCIKKSQVEKVLYFSNTLFVRQTTYALMCVVLCTCEIKICNCNADILLTLENTHDDSCIHSGFRVVAV